MNRAIGTSYKDVVSLTTLLIEDRSFSDGREASVGGRSGFLSRFQGGSGVSDSNFSSLFLLSSSFTSSSDICARRVIRSSLSRWFCCFSRTRSLAWLIRFRSLEGSRSDNYIGNNF